MAHKFNISLGIMPGLITVEDDHSVSIAYGDECWNFGRDWTPVMYTQGQRTVTFAANDMTITKATDGGGQAGEPIVVDFNDADLRSFVRPQQIILGRLTHSPEFPREFYKVTPSAAFDGLYPTATYPLPR